MAFIYILYNKYIYRPFQYDCTSMWPYELVLVALRSVVVSLRCVLVTMEILIPFWFVHEDSQLVDKTT